MNPTQLKTLSSRWPIFPIHWIEGGHCSCSQVCNSPGKHPLTRRGVKSATQDWERIAAWHEHWPKANWGIACGGNTRLLVVDIDDYGNADSIMRRLSPDGNYPDCPTVETGSGGMHLYFTAPEGWHPKNSASAIADGVDIRTEGGYVLAPGSRNLQGGYNWIEFEDEEPPEAPDWLIDLINRAQAPAKKAAPIRSAHGLIVNGWHDWVCSTTRALYEMGMDRDVVLSTVKNQAKTTLDFAARPERKLTDKEILDAYDGAAGKYPQFTHQDELEAQAMQAALIASMNAEPSEPAPKNTTLPKHLFERLHGPLRSLYEYCLKAPRPQPELSLAASLATFGAILGGRVESAHMGTRTNIYAVGVCGSGGGKDAPRQACKKAMAAASLDAYIGADYWQSASAIHTQLTEHSRRISFIDEFGKVLSSVGDRSASIHLKEIPNVLLKVWGASNGRYDGAAYADGKRNVLLDEPNLCVFGTTTHGTLFANLTTEHYTDGLLARCIVVAAADDLPPMNHGYTPEMPHPGLVESLKAWKNFGQGDLLGTARIHLTDAARDMLIRYSDQCDARRRDNSDKLMVLWSRAHEKALKISIIYACATSDPMADEPPVIDGACVDWAIDFIEATTNYAIEECSRSVAETYHEKDLVALEAFIRGYPEGLTLSQLRAKYRKVKSDRLNELRLELEEQGRIAIRTHVPDGGKGRPVNVVYAI